MLQALFTDNKAKHQVFLVYAGFYFLCAVFLGLPTLLISWIIKRSLFPRLPYFVLLAVSAICGALFLPVVDLKTVLVSLFDRPVELLVVLWLGSIPFAPLVAGILWVFEWVVEHLRPRTLQEHLDHQAHLEERYTYRLSERAERITRKMSPTKKEALYLGAFIQGDTFPAHLDIAQDGAWVSLTDRILPQHTLVVGTTGAGKTVTLTRIIAEALRATDRDVFVVDGKGDSEWAATLAALMYHYRRHPVPLFTLGLSEGQSTASSVYHGFCGSKEAIYNRLCSMVGVDEAEGNATYYADMNRDLLQLICFAPGQPPRSFEEVRERLTKEWLFQTYQDDPIELATIQDIDKRAIQGLLVRIRPLVREFAPVVDPKGFTLEDSRGALFSLRTQSVGGTARRFLQFLVEDLKDFIGNRQKRPGLLVIDEFGTFNNQNIVALLQLARSSNLGVVLATQDSASFGDIQTTRLIVANTRTKFLMATDYPEELAKLAGTIYQIEASIQHQEGDVTGLGSVRVQQAFRINMNEAARLKPGEGFLIRQRYTAKVKIAQTSRPAVYPQVLARFTKSRTSVTGDVFQFKHVPELEL